MFTAESQKIMLISYKVPLILWYLSGLASAECRFFGVNHQVGTANTLIGTPGKQVWHTFSRGWHSMDWFGAQSML